MAQADLSPTYAQPISALRPAASAPVFDAFTSPRIALGRDRGINVRARLADDGTFLIVEPMAGERLEDNLNLVGRIFYSAGLFICLAHAKAQGGAHELGPQVPEATWRELLAEAGFSRFRRAAETPFNRVFEARP